MENHAKEYNVEEFERPSVTVDVILFTIKENKLKVLLIKRGAWPFEDMWAIPGGFISMDESLEHAAARELTEEAGIENVYLEQLYTFGDPKRDPRTRVITVAYFALVDSAKLKQSEKTDKEVTGSKWFPADTLPNLAFDHEKILKYAVRRLRYKLEYTAVGRELLPTDFTLTELQKVYEIILYKKLDKRNFRKKLASLDILKETNRYKRGHHRPAKLYSFRKNVELKSGFKSVQFEK